MSERRSSSCEVTHTFFCCLRRLSMISKLRGLYLSRAKWSGVVFWPGLFNDGLLCKNINGSMVNLGSFGVATRAVVMEWLTASSTFTLVANVWKIEIPSGNLAIGANEVIFPFASSCLSLLFSYLFQYVKSAREMKCWILPGWVNSKYFYLSSWTFFYPAKLVLSSSWGHQSLSFSMSKNWFGRLFCKLIKAPLSSIMLKFVVLLPPKHRRKRYSGLMLFS